MLGELNRASAKALHLIASAETFMNGSLSAGEQELSKSAIDQLITVAEEAEEMALPLSRCVKFQKVSLEGGYTGTNLKVLAAQAHDILSKLTTCSRMVRAIMKGQGT